MILFPNYVCFEVAGNNHVIWAALTKTHGGIAVWKDQTILFTPEGNTNDYGAVDLRWRESDGALLVSSCNEAGDQVYVWVVPGVSYQTG